MQNESSPAVSVIIPVYNVENYLSQCLDSILAQTLDNIEIICVDDGSEDNSRIILEQYAKNDNRIHILYQQNLYSGAARNNGLKIATGEYIIFLDSDDYFVPEMLEHTYKAAQEHKSDIVLFNGFRYDDINQEITKTGDFLRSDYLPKADVFSWVDIPDYIFNLSNPAPWCKLYSRDFILNTGLQFSMQPHSNDSFFTLTSMVLAQRITAVCENLIYYRINRTNSLQYSKQENPLCFLTALDDLYNELVQRDLYIPLQTSFRHKALSVICSNLRDIKTDKARWQILDALDNEPYSKLPIKEIPGVDDGNPQVHRSSCQLDNAQNQYHHSLQVRSAIEKLNNEFTASPVISSVKVSIIIPVYNTELYLDETIASIANQTLNDIEIICIDDGSTDNSLQILRRWAAKDNRIIVVTQSNTGQGIARNVGIARAQGKYLYLMDSDDILEKEALEQLVNIMEEKQLDSLYFDAASFFEDEDIENNFARFRNMYIRSRSYDEIYDGPTLFGIFCNDETYRVNVYMQFHRTSFVRENKLFFPGVVHDDNVFTFAALIHAKRVSHISYPFIHRRMRPNSLMTQDVTFNSVYGYYRDYLEMLKIYQNTSNKLSEEICEIALDRIRRMLSNAQNDYAKLNAEKRGGEWGLLENFKYFDTLVAKPGRYKLQLTDTNRKLQTMNKTISELKVNNKLMSETNKDLESQIQYLYQEPDRIHASFSYRLGRALTLPIRKIRSYFNKMRMRDTEKYE